MVADFEHEDIDQSLHPAVTVAPHLLKHIGVVIVSDSDGGVETFQPLLPAQTAIPARRIAEFPGPAEGGNVVVKFVEGSRDIVAHTPEPKQPNGEKKADEDEDDDDSEDDEDDEPEEVRSKVLKVDTLLAEALLKDVKKGQRVEVTVNVSADMALNVAARIVGTQQGVRGQVKAAA